ncbi:MAG TPA: SDR family oxidoreductase [Puia sp.]|jgi:putative NADH-flavin reductase|nr:SDR family oxidoreductase [Puia sp.]
MKLLIIGGTGGTGKELITQALEQGHILTALVRNPKKVHITHQNLSVIKGNILDFNKVQEVVAGQDAVLSALGHKIFFIKTNILSEGTKNIIGAMEMHSVSRFICITSLGIGDSRFKLGLYYTLFVIPVIVFFYFLDKGKQEKLIRNSKLNWTIVRPGQLTNGKKRGIYKHGAHTGNYILTKMISRADVAHFVLCQLSDTNYVLKAPGVTY